MKKQKSTKRALLMSALSLLMCVSMLIGSTYAWFTDTASTGVNKIQSGTLDMEVYHKVGDDWERIDGVTNLFSNVNGDPILWEPGVTATETFKIVNKGNLAFKYAFFLNYANATETEAGKTLADVLTCSVYDEDGPWVPDHEITKLEDVKFNGILLADADQSVSVDITWTPTDHDNDYNVEGGLSIDLGVKVFATQYTYEKDSTDEQYDKDATLPDVWDGTVGTLPAVENNVLTIKNASQLAAFAKEVNKGTASTTYAGVTVNLTCDIDLAGHEWTPIGLEGSLHNNFQGTFNGNGHTISNMTVSGIQPVGFFGFFTGTVKNLKFDNATVTGNHWGGVIAGYASYDNTVIENCTVTNSTVQLSFNTAKNDDGDKAGAITGYLNGNVTVKNNTVDNCTVIAVRDAGALLGCNGTCTDSSCISGNTVKNSTVYTESDFIGEIVGRQINGFVLATTNTAENVTTKSAKFAETSTPAVLADALKATTEIIDVTLTDDVAVNISDLSENQTGGSGQYKLGGADTKTINIDLNGHKLTLNTTYWSALGAKNSGAVITVKNGSMNSSQTNGTWNSYDLTFYDCKWNFENVTFDKAVAIATGADTTMKNVVINESNSNAAAYALWITADGQTVTLNNVTIRSNGGKDTRGIAIKDEYREAPAEVTLNITDCKFATAKKAAVLVTSRAGATITASNVDISAVAADKINLVWVDNGANYKNTNDVTVTGAKVILEP